MLINRFQQVNGRYMIFSSFFFFLNGLLFVLYYWYTEWSTVKQTIGLNCLFVKSYDKYAYHLFDKQFCRNSIVWLINLLIHCWINHLIKWLIVLELLNPSIDWLITCICRTILSTIGLGPVTNPSRIPELRILENESNLQQLKVVKESKISAQFSQVYLALNMSSSQLQISSSPDYSAIGEISIDLKLLN